jgi:multimeric flavodoxin WrbA
MGKITLINGSPRKENCTKMIDFVVPFIEKAGHSTKVITLAEKKINFCLGCGYCKKAKKCIQKDDGNSVNKELADSDAIIFVTPVYFGNMSSQLKAMIDRTLPLRVDDFKLKDKIGAVFAVGKSRNGGQETTITGVMNAMHIHGMIVVGDDSHFGGMVQSPFEKDDVGKETLKGTAEKICRLLNKSNKSEK